MQHIRTPSVAIVDFGLGNLFSVKRAVEYVGAQAMVTSEPSTIHDADGLILPGVGAFGDAMANLQKRGLVDVLKKAIASGKPFMGVCLGMQLLMEESTEFGFHRGLGIFAGTVLRFDAPKDEQGKELKVPEVGWNSIARPIGTSSDPWVGSPLEGLSDDTAQYFVHSYTVVPSDVSIVLAVSRYGHIDFCSAVKRNNIFACQFHPEKSGPSGLAIYRNFVTLVTQRV